MIFFHFVFHSNKSTYKATHVSESTEHLSESSQFVSELDVSESNRLNTLANWTLAKRPATARTVRNGPECSGERLFLQGTRRNDP